MAWLKIDDQFAEHEKIADLGDRSFRLHVVALCYCARNLTDGILDERAVRVVAAIITRGSVKRNIAELVGVGLWRELADGGYAIKDFLEYNPSSAKVKEQREQARVRMSKLRSSREQTTNIPENERRTFGDPVPSRKKPEALDLPGTPQKHQIRRLIDDQLREAVA